MCLYINKERTRRVRRTLRDNGGKAIMWKVLTKGFSKSLRLERSGLHHNKLRGRLNVYDSLQAIHYMMDYKPGVIISDRSNYDNKGLRIALGINEKRYNSINHAIHVFTNRRKALDESRWRHRSIVVPVQVLMKNFIAAGTNYDAAFTKVRLLKKDFDKAMKTGTYRE